MRRLGAGAEDGRSGRARGLKKRLGELLAHDEAGLVDLDAALEAARQLYWTGWPKRLSNFQPTGPAETFFMHLRNAIYGRVADAQSPYDIQAHLHPAGHDIAAAASAFKKFLIQLGAPEQPVKRLKTILDDKADELETSQRARIEGAIQGLELRASGPLAAWQLMLADIASGPRDGFVDWMQIDRIDGQDRDIGVARH